MLLKITRKCLMGCTHCLEDATLDGKHMEWSTFENVLRFIDNVRPLIILVSGGEPLDHPQFFEIIQELLKIYSKEQLLITSNGLFLYDKDLTERVLQLGVNIQVTNDIRYYPMAINTTVEHPNLVYESHIRSLYPQGRARTNNMPIVNSKAPKCFNLRSVAKSTNYSSLPEVIHTLEMHGKFCTPTVGINGEILLGESSLCGNIGYVTDTNETLMKNLRNFSCNRCGMEDKLQPQYKAAITPVMGF